MRRRWETAPVVASVQAVGKVSRVVAIQMSLGKGEVRIVRDFTGRRDAHPRFPTERIPVGDAAFPESPFSRGTDAVQMHEGGVQHRQSRRTVSGIVALISGHKQVRVRDWCGVSSPDVARVLRRG